MAMISRAYIDESGGLDTPQMVLAGLIGSTDMWESFSKDWQAVLDEEPHWSSFHAVECESGRGEYATQEHRERQRRIGRLIEVLANHRPFGFVSYVDTERFARDSKIRDTDRKSRQSWQHAYTFLASVTFGGLIDLEGAGAGPLGVIETVFDYQQQFKSYTREKIVESVIGELEKDIPKLAGRLAPPQWPKNRELREYTPLQAADLLAWNIRRGLSTVDGKQRRAYRNLVNAIEIRYLSGEGSYRPDMHWIASHQIHEPI